MKDETSIFGNEEFVGLKPKMYSILVDNNSEHKKTKNMNRNVVGTISHNEYKDVSLNSKCIRHSINRIQSEDHRIIYIHTHTHKTMDTHTHTHTHTHTKNNLYDGLALGYQS